MGRFPGEESCLTLVWAVLTPDHPPNQRIHFTALDRTPQTSRYQDTDHTIPEEVTAA